MHGIVCTVSLCFASLVASTDGHARHGQVRVVTSSKGLTRHAEGAIAGKVVPARGAGSMDAAVEQLALERVNLAFEREDDDLLRDLAMHGDGLTRFDGSIDFVSSRKRDADAESRRNADS